MHFHAAAVEQPNAPARSCVERFRVCVCVCMCMCVCMCRSDMAVLMQVFLAVTDKLFEPLYKLAVLLCTSGTPSPIDRKILDIARRVWQTTLFNMHVMVDVDTAASHVLTQQQQQQPATDIPMDVSGDTSQSYGLRLFSAIQQTGAGNQTTVLACARRAVWDNQDVHTHFTVNGLHEMLDAYVHASRSSARLGTRLSKRKIADQHDVGGSRVRESAFWSALVRIACQGMTTSTEALDECLLRQWAAALGDLLSKMATLQVYVPTAEDLSKQQLEFLRTEVIERHVLPALTGVEGSGTTAGCSACQPLCLLLLAVLISTAARFQCSLQLTRHLVHVESMLVEENSEYLNALLRVVTATTVDSFLAHCPFLLLLICCPVQDEDEDACVVDERSAVLQCLLGMYGQSRKLDTFLRLLAESVQRRDYARSRHQTTLLTSACAIHALQTQSAKWLLFPQLQELADALLELLRQETQQAKLVPAKCNALCVLLCTAVAAVLCAPSTTARQRERLGVSVREQWHSVAQAGLKREQSVLAALSLHYVGLRYMREYAEVYGNLESTRQSAEAIHVRVKGASQLMLVSCPSPEQSTSAMMTVQSCRIACLLACPCRIWSKSCRLVVGWAQPALPICQSRHWTLRAALWIVCAVADAFPLPTPTPTPTGYTHCRCSLHTMHKP